MPQRGNFAVGQVRGHDGNLVLIDVVADQVRFERRTRGPQGQGRRVQEVGLHALREHATHNVDLVGRAVRALVLGFERDDDGSTPGGGGGLTPGGGGGSTLCHIPCVLRDACTT